MKYTCSRCGYNSENATAVKRHIVKKKKCSPDLNDIIPSIIEENLTVECEHCHKNFHNSSNLKRHQKTTCKQKVEILEKQLHEAHNRILELEKSKSTVINIQQNFIINGYKDTSFNHLKDKHYKNAINRMLMCVPNLISDVHFSSKAPENHNIYISNIRGKYAMVWDGRNWEARDQNEMINKIIMDNEYAIEEWIDEDKFPQEMKKFNEYLELKESPDLVNGRTALDVIREEVKLVLYNNRKLIKI